MCAAAMAQSLNGKLDAWLNAQTPVASPKKRNIRINDDDDEPEQRPADSKTHIITIQDSDSEPETAPQQPACSQKPIVASQGDTRKTKSTEKAASRNSPKNRPKPSRWIDAEAEEDEECDTGSSDAESDVNAGEIYRSAMLGVRNRSNAMHQVRAEATPCATCALFARFIQAFL